MKTAGGIQPLLHAAFGLALFFGVGLVSTAAAAVYVLAGLVKSRAAGLLIGALGFVFLTSPGLLALLLGPVVFAFVFGKVGE